MEKQRSVCVITQQETSSGTAACRASRCSGARSWPVGWASDCRWMLLLRSAKVSLAAHPERCLICVGALPVLCLALLALPLVVRLFCTSDEGKRSYAIVSHCVKNLISNNSWCLEVTLTTMTACIYDRPHGNMMIMCHSERFSGSVKFNLKWGNKRCRLEICMLKYI